VGIAEGDTEAPYHRLRFTERKNTHWLARPQLPISADEHRVSELRNYRTRPKLSFSVRAIVLRRVANWALEAIGHFAMIASSPSPARMAGLDLERSYDSAYAIKEVDD
jgi:hypothetical protein